MTSSERRTCGGGGRVRAVGARLCALQLTAHHTLAPYYLIIYYLSRNQKAISIFTLELCKILVKIVIEAIILYYSAEIFVKSLNMAYHWSRKNLNYNTIFYNIHVFEKLVDVLHNTRDTTAFSSQNYLPSGTIIRFVTWNVQIHYRHVMIIIIVRLTLSMGQLCH